MKLSLSKYLNKKIVLPTTIVSIISAIVLMISSSITSVQNIRNDLETRSDAIQDQLTDYLESYEKLQREWNSYQNCLDYLLSDESQGKLVDDMYATLENVVENNDNILTTWLYRDRNQTMLINDRSISQGFDFDRIYIAADNKYNDNFYISGPYEDAVTGEIVVSMYYLLTYNNSRIGAIGYDIALNSIPDMIQAHEFDLDGKALLLADDGIVLSSPNVSENNQFIEDLDVSEAFVNALKENGDGSVQCKYNGKMYSMVYKTVPNTRWNITVVTPVTSIMLKVVRDGIFTLLVLVILNILVSVILRRESKRIAKKIENLAVDSTEISNENYDLQLEVDDETEIGSLQDATIKILNRLKEYKSYIAELSTIMDYMSKCDYTHSTTLDYTGEFELIKSTLVSLKEGTVDLVSELGQVSSYIVTGAEEISTVSGHLAQGAEAQTNYVGDFSNELNSVLGLLEQTISMLHEVEEKSNNANSQLTNGTEQMKNLVDTMKNTKDTANEITNILQTQKEISSRINLLSLNASIEAARAGEAGQGFAVVAMEIGKLADESSKATAETSILIENTINAVNAGQIMVTDTNNSFTALSTDISDMVVAFNQNIQGLMSQIHKFDSIKTGMVQISDIANDTLAVSQQTAASAESFTEYAEQLKSLIDKYKI